VSRARLTLLCAFVVAVGCADDSPVEADDDDTVVEYGEPFSLVVVPDIQYVTLGYPEILTATTEWIVDERDEQGIAYVLQEGDLTHENSPAEWTAADEGFAVLDGVVPYALCVGNHDMDEDEDTSLFRGTFPPSRFEDSGLGGTRAPDVMDDAWFEFTAGGVDWLVLSLTYNPSEDAIAWADGVAADHPDHRSIVLTHAYLGPSGERTFLGERIWLGLVSRHRGMTFVFNGHYVDGEAAYLASEGDHGNTVHQLFANFQDRPFGGAGLVRILALDPAAGEVSVTTYSPWLEFFESDEAHEFLLEGVDLGAP
jgi:hypothetical protein